MNRITYLLTLAIASFASAGARADAAKFVVVGYLPDYRITGVAPERIAPVTDLVYFGLEPPADGRLPPSPVAPTTLQRLREIKRVANCRLLLCVGGWNRSGGFPTLTMSDAARRRFIAGLLEFCQKNDFDGVDYDWEHPRGADQLNAYVRLLAETKAAFRDSQLLVTVAQAGWQNLGKAAYSAVDRVHLMSYDHEFPHATFAKSRADVDRLVGWQCPPARIALGLPFYGRNNANEARTYSELASQKTIDPKLDRIDGFAFNGKATITRKVQFAATRELAGIMIWELGQDASTNDESLLMTIHRHLRSTPEQATAR